MYRVLHVMAGADAGGISTVVLNYYRFMDRQKIHFDVALTTNMVGRNAAELEKLGANILQLPLKSQGLAAFHRGLRELLKKGHYDAIHVHENETSYVALFVAMEMGIPKRIAHAHTTAPTYSLKSELRRLSGCTLNYAFATNVVGCGQLAGERVFGKRHMNASKAVIMPNAINISKFTFSHSVRDEVRRELGVKEKRVVGMVGRLSSQKNYGFAIEVMTKYCRKHPDTVLLIAGNGEDEQKIRDQIQKKEMTQNIILLGRRSDVERLYMAFDLFLLPSLYEGFPVAGIEAVCTGLPVLLSDTITRELSSFHSVAYLPINNTDAWTAAIEKVGENTDRLKAASEVKANGFDLVDAAKKMEQLYFS